MMRMTVLGSGSKGNSAVISTERSSLLLDAGLSCRELMKRMGAAGEDPERLDAILITHEHQDHIHGLPVLARKLGIPVFFTEATHRAWSQAVTPSQTMSYSAWLEQRVQEQRVQEQRVQEQKVQEQKVQEQKAVALQAEELLHDASVDQRVSIEASAVADIPGGVAGRDREPATPELVTQGGGKSRREAGREIGREAGREAELPAVEYFRAGTGFCVGDISVMPFTVPHDAVDPVGFVFEAQGIRLGIATDLGYMPPNVRMHLRGCAVVMLESNHDLEMLRDGPYPWSLKQRVLSRVGHLSNEAAAGFLAEDYDGGAEYVVLAHLSESNNLPELARLSAERALGRKMNLLGNRLLLASQTEPMESIVL